MSVYTHYFILQELHDGLFILLNLRVRWSGAQFGILIFIRDEPQKQDTQANKRSPLLSEEVRYQITLIRLVSQGVWIGGY